MKKFAGQLLTIDELAKNNLNPKNFEKMDAIINGQCQRCGNLKLFKHEKDILFCFECHEFGRLDSLNYLF